jgi:putative ABC transport system substrate-binding protein
MECSDTLTQHHACEVLVRRREFIAVLGWAVTKLADPAHGQQSAKVAAIGFLGVAPASAYSSRLAALRSGLKEVGYIEGRNFEIEFRWAERADQLPELAAELAKREIAVIVTSGNSATRAAKAATSTIPIVFSMADDPVQLGFVSSFNRPGGNMTGLSLVSGALGAKRLELVRELLPHATVIALLTNPNNPAEKNVRTEQETARAIGQRVLVLEAGTAVEIEHALTALIPQQANALLVNADAFFTAENLQKSAA